jgi:serine phosphatase RsbU (regulator of sigma subunit)
MRSPLVTGGAPREPGQVVDHDGVSEQGISSVQWLPAVRAVLAEVVGNHVLLLPVMDGDEVVDFEITAAAPDSVDAYGRRGEETVGSRLRKDYGDAIQGEVWEAFRDAYLDGRPRTVSSFPFAGSTGGPPARFTARLRRVGEGLLNSWSRDDEPGRLDERIAQTELLAGLGWSEQDLVTGVTVWSEQLYRIYERDPEAGPMSGEESEAMTLPEDRPIWRRAAEHLSLGRPVDVTYRIRVNGRVKHVRALGDTVRDVHGRPLRIFGLLQDVTARVTSRTRIARIEQQLHEQQRNLAAESRLVTELQQIILPIPFAPVDIGRLRVAVRYLPAEQANRIGGDWFHAGWAYDGNVILAVGDVAGHGIRSAATMAQLRQAFVTLSTAATSDPAELLHYLNRLLLADSESGTVASAVAARFDPATGIIEWAQAGHPTPLRTRAGATEELARPPGPLLGAVPDPQYQLARFRLEEGDLLLFYTDGLIERRGRTLEEGLQPVIATLNRLSAGGSHAPLTDLLSQLRRANPRDDTCVLAVRLLTAEELAATSKVPTPALIVPDDG